MPSCTTARVPAATLRPRSRHETIGPKRASSTSQTIHAQPAHRHQLPRHARLWARGPRPVATTAHVPRIRPTRLHPSLPPHRPWPCYPSHNFRKRQTRRNCAGEKQSSRCAVDKHFASRPSGNRSEDTQRLQSKKAAHELTRCSVHSVHRRRPCGHFAGCTILLTSPATIRATRTVGRICWSDAHSLPGTSTRLIGAARTHPPMSRPHHPARVFIRARHSRASGIPGI